MLETEWSQAEKISCSMLFVNCFPYEAFVYQEGNVYQGMGDHLIDVGR